MKSSRRNLWIAAAVLLLSGALAGCSRPGDENINKLLVSTYTCKSMELVEYARTDSLPGIFSYVAQYSFQYRFKDGEEGAKKFFKELFAEMDMKGDNWEEWTNSDKVQDFLADDCTEAGQMALERMVDTVLPQIQEKKDTVRLPVVMPMVGWSELMTSKKGWDITVRRDKVGGEPMWSNPIKREELLAGKKAATAKIGKPKAQKQ